jgi:hypothetical protein
MNNLVIQVVNQLAMLWLWDNRLLTSEINAAWASLKARENLKNTINRLWTGDTALPNAVVGSIPQTMPSGGQQTVQPSGLPMRPELWPFAGAFGPVGYLGGGWYPWGG